MIGYLSESFAWEDLVGVLNFRLFYVSRTCIKLFIQARETIHYRRLSWLSTEDQPTLTTLLRYCFPSISSKQK
jgi:hypothetical protein